MKKYRYSRLSIFISKLINLFIDLSPNAIVINACLHYDYGKLLHRNWGDDINNYFIKFLTGRKVSYLYNSRLANKKKCDNFLIIGSTITMLTNPQTIIWGAGVINPNQKLPAYPKKVLAVRGPLSRKYLLDNNIDCPPVYGDPAMLLKYYYQPNKKKKYKLGLIPHYDDFSHPTVNKLKENKEVLVIKMEGYYKWLDVIDQICSCEYIASSSLHGLIIAETYNIPNLWVELNGELLGGHFKFHDFFLSINCDRESPYILTTEDTLENILKTRTQYKKGNINLDPLISNAPFTINIIKDGRQ